VDGGRSATVLQAAALSLLLADQQQQQSAWLQQLLLSNAARRSPHLRDAQPSIDLTGGLHPPKRRTAARSCYACWPV